VAGLRVAASLQVAASLRAADAVRADRATGRVDRVVRIVAGEFRGRALAAPRTQTIRPTSDRLRESLFNVLAHGYDDVVADARVLDLFAGTGALGLEAVSRGARYALFVEEGVEARGLIRDNIEALGLTGRTKLFRRDATKLGPAGTVEPFQLVFADPPYGRGLGEQALASAVEGGWLAPGALVVLEEEAKAVIEEIPGLERLEIRQAGESQLVFLKFNVW
jgi:16S rRNA (guanine966-N2)-methyltransferase